MASRTTTDPIEILLEMGVDLDNLSEEEDYLSALMEAIATIEFKTKGKGDARSAALRQEVIKIRKGKRKPQAKKTKISADSFKKGSATTTASVGQKALPSANIKPKTSIIPYQKPDEVDEEEEGGKKKKARTRKTDKDQKLLEGIAKSVSNIADILKDQYGLKKKKAAYDRKKAEADRRKLKESNLEKSFKGLASAAEKIIAPVKGALDSILDFFINIIIGRFLVKFIRWFGDPKNAKKVDSVVRFLVDHGPKLLAAFLLFGTSIGRFAVRLSAMLLKGALRLGAAAAKFALGFARRHPAAAAITAIVGGAAIGGIMQANTQSNDPDAPEGRTQLEDTMDYGGVTGDPVAGAFSAGGIVPSYEEGGTVGGFVPNFFGMAKGAGSSIKEKGFGNAALDFAGGALGGVKNFMDEKGISDVLMAHPLAKLGLLGFDKGKQLLGGLTDHLNETGLTDILMQHPLAKMGAFGLDKFMNFGKDPARDITGESGKDITGAGVDTQLISARPGDFVVNKKTADAMGPDYFDAISTDTGEKVSGAGPDTQMIAVRPGEIVVNRETVNALGPDHFLGLNRLFGGAGANKPKMAKVQSASNGGFVLPAFSSGGQVGSYNNHRGAGAGSPKKGYEGQRGYSSGSLASDPLGALDRIIGQSSGGKFRLPGMGSESPTSPPSRPEPSKSDPQPKPKSKPPQSKPPKSKPESKPKEPLIPGKADPLPPEEPGIPEKMLKSPTFRDSGLLYLRHLMGGLGGAITEQDLSKETKHELNLAIGRAKERHAGNLAKATREWEEAKKGGWDKSSSKEGRDAYATRKSQYERLKSGQVQVLYQDYYDGNNEKNITKSAENAKSVLGQFWAQQTKEGGYRIVNEKYDFQPMNDPLAVLMGDSRGIAKDAKDGKPGQEISLRNKLQAIAQLNPFTKDMSVDMILGQPESAERKTNNILRKMGGVMDFIMRDTTDFDGQGVVASNEVKGEMGVPFPETAPAKPETPLLPEKTQEKLDAKPKLTAQQIKNNQAYAESKGKYYSSTTNKTYANYAAALKDPAVAAGAEKMEQKKQSTMNMILGGKDAYYSSTTGMYYKNYAEALKDPKVAAAAKVEKTKASLSFPTPSMTMPEPPPGGGNNVKVIRIPSSATPDNPNDRSTGGSDVDAAATGNGNKAKWNILGIPMPF